MFWASWGARAGVDVSASAALAPGLVPLWVSAVPVPERSARGAPAASPKAAIWVASWPVALSLPLPLPIDRRLGGLLGHGGERGFGAVDVLRPLRRRDTTGLTFGGGAIGRRFLPARGDFSR